ncbi:hypothetical protein [Streptomyces purpurascens]|uniref:Uncharacterized protein n=1 Tax=Streptomyces purpurascens TaxID=1924 RepID=A0ABZ1MR57_STREF|nr:hypothetical protein [Streptomyces purpurascens]MCE7045706.1 hypothetical protein [Streptomyces purpurascens]
MRSIARIAVIGATAAIVAAGTSTSAFAEDATIHSVGLDARSKFVANGDHLYITDMRKDGHSAIGIIERGAQYYYWNRDGVDTTRHVNLDLEENRAIALGAVIGDWSGTPTGGIIWSTLSTTTISTS